MAALTSSKPYDFPGPLKLTRFDATAGRDTIQPLSRQSSSDCLSEIYEKMDVESIVNNMAGLNFDRFNQVSNCEVRGGHATKFNYVPRTPPSSLMLDITEFASKNNEQHIAEFLKHNRNYLSRCRNLTVLENCNQLLETIEHISLKLLRIVSEKPSFHVIRPTSSPDSPASEDGDELSRLFQALDYLNHQVTVRPILTPDSIQDLKSIQQEITLSKIAILKQRHLIKSDLRS